MLGGGGVVEREKMYLVGLLNALDTAHEPYNQEYSLLGTGTGSLQPMLLNQQMNLESSLSVIGPKDLQGLIGLFALSSKNQLELELRPRLSSVLRSCPKGAFSSFTALAPVIPPALAPGIPPVTSTHNLHCRTNFPRILFAYLPGYQI